MDTPFSHCLLYYFLGGIIMSEKKTRPERTPNKIESLLPIIVLLTLMILNYVLDWGQDPHIPVLFAAVTAVIVGLVCGQNIKDILAAGYDSISQSLEALFILIFVGCLVGSFEWAGTIPSLVYYGLEILTPAVFLPAVTILCAAVGLSLGSAYTVTATLGIAFMTIGNTMGINPGLIAGAILSGGCCGDKFSPLSDSTNLAAASAQTNLFDHVKAMVTTTFPSLLIAIVIFTVLSLGTGGEYDPTIANELQQAILDTYPHMSPLLLIPILMIIVFAVIQMSPVPAVLVLAGIGCLFAVIFQGASFNDCITMLHYGFSAETGNELCDTLVNRGGMDSMMWTINVAIIAIAFGGIYFKIGAVETILGALMKKVTTPLQLVALTIITAMFCITTMCDQYLGLIIPASMYKDKYDELGLGRNMLSRSMEDGGTLYSPLVPWTSCGAYHSRMLGIDTLTYLPYCFMNLINPIVAIVTAAWGGNILYADGSKTTFFGRLKKGKEAAAPEEAHAKALESLERLRAEGAKGYKSFK